MTIHDISLTITPDLVVWPGDPRVNLERVAKIEEGANHNGSQIGPVSVHIGTHVDAPFHFVPGGSTVESLPLDILIGPCQVVDLPDAKVIDAETLVYAGIEKGATRVLFKTRNSTFWSEKRPTFQEDFVGISADGAEFLVWQGIKLVGLDYLSIAPYHKSKETHQILLQHGMVVVEGLDLSGIKPGNYDLICLPWKLAGSDGAPARAVLVDAGDEEPNSQ